MFDCRLYHIFEWVLSFEIKEFKSQISQRSIISDHLKVKSPTSLLKFLFESLQDWKRNTIKKRLKEGCIAVNEIVITQHNHELREGDVVQIHAGPQSNKPKNIQSSKLQILYSDHDLIAINKPAGLLSVTAGKENKNHALALLRDQLSTPKKPVALWPVHRLDRDTSGVLLFATSKKIREEVACSWSLAQKTYFAITEGCPKQREGTINQPLRLDSDQYVMHVGKHPNAKKAITHYKVKQTTKTRSLLEVQIETGRQHQIRAHLSWLGCPIVGDERYGTKGPRMGLHAFKLSLIHPKTKKRLTVESVVQDEFLDLLKK